MTNLLPDLIDLGRCAICPASNRCVLGDGPCGDNGASVMCIGEEPGREEDNGGRAFIGMAGREFNLNYLPLAGLRRSLYDAGDSDVYVTNARKCRMGQNKTPTYNEMIRCANHFIPRELSVVNPAVVILMGSVPCKLLGERGVDLESEHGIPRWGKLYDWEGWVVPIYHPAAGLHDGNMMTPMLADWERLGPWLRDGTWAWAEDKIEHRDYRLCRTVNDVDQYFLRYGIPVLQLPNVESYLRHRPLLGLDTETHVGVRWSIQTSVRSGTGIMIQTDTGAFDGRLLQALRHWVMEYEWVMHNAEADLWVADLLNLPNQPYRDTMQEAYQFQNLPQKLKAIARRVLGRTRLDWDGLVTPYSKEILAQWMMNAFVHSENTYRQEIARKHKKSGKPLSPHIVLSEPEKLLPRLLSYMQDNMDYPIWQKLYERIPAVWLDKLIAAAGPIPQKGIAHVPLDAAVYYGCSDADDTLAAALRFERMRREFKAELAVTEEDRDEVIRGAL